MFRTFRLIGLVAIIVTGVVYHVALASIFDLDGIDQRVAWLSLLFPVCWRS